VALGGLDLILVDELDQRFQPNTRKNDEYDDDDDDDDYYYPYKR